MPSLFEATFGKGNQAPQVELDLQTCATCGIAFGAPAHFFKERRADHRTFYCPNGHGLGFGKSAAEIETEKLRRQLEEKDRRIRFEQEQSACERRQREATERRLSATKGVLTRTKNRVSKGVCPSCNRQFENLHRHMNAKHPDYAAAEGDSK
ncbi:MAG: hypothetical protein WCD76_17770 [Pyrinomonadaceae bacterium]